VKEAKLNFEVCKNFKTNIKKKLTLLATYPDCTGQQMLLLLCVRGSTSLEICTAAVLSLV
jgi:hypothetical protein